MKKKIVILGIFIFVLIFIYCFNNDNFRFKLSYEYINYMEYNNGKTIKVKVPIKNRVKYIGNKELIQLFENETGIVYFGYNTCPWCRNSVPILIDAIVENGVNVLYYVDVHKVDIDKKVYDLLDDYLSVDEDGNKRLAVPNVFAIKDGKIFNNHLGTVDSYHNPYKKMNGKQKQELKDIYNELIKEIK